MIEFENFVVPKKAPKFVDVVRLGKTLTATQIKLEPISTIFERFTENWNFGIYLFSLLLFHKTYSF